MFSKALILSTLASFAAAAVYNTTTVAGDVQTTVITVTSCDTTCTEVPVTTGVTVVTVTSHSLTTEYTTYCPLPSEAPSSSAPGTTVVPPASSAPETPASSAPETPASSAPETPATSAPGTTVVPPATSFGTPASSAPETSAPATSVVPPVASSETPAASSAPSSEAPAPSATTPTTAVITTSETPASSGTTEVPSVSTGGANKLNGVAGAVVAGVAGIFLL